MPSRILLAAGALVAVLFALAPSWATAASAAPTCAVTSDPSAPAHPTAGAPCWTDVQPYPFGTDGGPVDASSPACRPSTASGPGYSGEPLSCYLTVDSLAFRAFNRGLAAASQASGAGGTTAFGVWLFNGTRWFPDPTFPGQSVCKGNKVLWAGKRDYWLVGGPASRSRDWPPLCRFDGVNFEWQPLDVPGATLDRVPRQSDGTREPGAIEAGSCPTWDNCTFFGDNGVRVHWDGVALSDASPDLAGQPWLATDYRDASTGTDAAGSPYAYAVGSSGGVLTGEQLPPQPDGSPPPQLYGAVKGPFGPLPFSPPTDPQPGDPYRTDLVSVAFDADGHGWVAGNPAGEQPVTSIGSDFGTRRPTRPAPSPLSALSADGTAAACPETPPDRFRFPSTPGSEDGLLWAAVDALARQGGGTPDALAAGQVVPKTAGTNANDDGSREPVLVRARCDGAPTQSRFRVGDPFASNQATATPVPAARGGFATAVAAPASNDAWAATTPGSLVVPSDASRQAAQRPRLYRYSDTEPPQAPAGDDNEPRPLVFAADPPIIVELPPDPEPAAPAGTTVTRQASRTTKRVRLKAAVYRVRAKVVTGKGHRYRLEIRFRVRRPVTLGVQALRRHRLVASSGLKHFRAPRGKLIVHLDRRHWPTAIRFVTPKAKPAKGSTPATALPRVPG